MKKRYNCGRAFKQLILAVPASALMLGSAQAQTTVGLNIQGYYYGAGTTNATTIGYGAGYQTTGFPVTATAFGVAVENWYNTVPLPGQATISTSFTFAGTLTAQLTAPDAWESGIGEQVAGWNPETVLPGNDEVTWAYLDDGNATGEAPSASVSGLASMFPNGYVVQTIAAEANVTTFDAVAFTDGVVTNDLVEYSTYYVNNPVNDGTDLGGTVGLSPQSFVFTADTIYINPQPKTTGNRSTLAGFIITDMPVVSQPPTGSTNNLGGSFTLSAGAIGIPPLSYQWQLNGTNLPGATASSYTNADAAVSAAGAYDVVVTNLSGVTTSQVATVAVLLAPTIEVDLPSSVTNYSTMNANFAVLAGGAQPLTYTWLKNGEAIPPATTSLLLTNLQSSDAGSYQVIVGNAVGSVTSAVVTLTVLSSLPPYEGFNYTAGDISGQNGGVGWSNAWALAGASDDVVIYPGLTYGPSISTLDTTGGALQTYVDDQRSFLCDLGGPGSGTFYFSFIGQFTNSGWEGIWFAEGTNDVTFLGQGWYEEPWGCGGFPYPAILAPASKPSTVQSFVVYRFDFNQTNTLVSISVNPTSLATEPATPDATGSLGYVLEFNTLQIIAHQYPISGAACGDVDELRFGGSWSSVAPYTIRTSPSFSLQTVPGGVIEDTKPFGTPHPGLSFDTTWTNSVTDNNSVTRTGVEQFSEANGGQITVAPDVDFDSTNGTICFWMLYSVPLSGFPGTGAEAAMLFDRRTTNGTIIGANVSGGIEFQALGEVAGVSTDVNHLVGSAYVVDGNWHQITITYDQSSNGVVSLYVDGNLDTSQANTAAWAWPATQEIELGRSHDAYWFIYDGQMDDFRMYNNILTPTEIAAIAAPSTSDSLEETNALEVRYNFDSGTYGYSLVWPFGTLQSSPTLSAGAVWTTLTNATSPMPFLPTNPATFYRLIGMP